MQQGTGFYGDGPPGSLRTRKLKRKGALWLERSSFDSHYREIARYVQPRLGRFITTDRNQGGKRHQNIIDNTGLLSLRTLAAGMMSGMTSPARPWFKNSVPDQDLMEFAPVKMWLHKLDRLMLRIFAASNTYRALGSCYEELGAFGTWANFVLDDFDTVIHHQPMTVGEYALATNKKGMVDTLAREFQMTVGQMVEQFGLNRCSIAVQNQFRAFNLDQWIDVVHMVEPRRERDTRKIDNLNMPFASCYFEPAADNPDKLLGESGFARFPALCPRWRVTGNDVYGDSPGMDALGDVKQLQQEQLRKGQAIDYKVNPPIQVPTAYKNQPMNRLPGGVFYVDSSSPTGGVRSAFEVNLDLNHLLEDINDVRDRVRSAFYADMFLMLANDTRSNVTATEVAERHEEKLLMLGPVLERLHNELLSPMIDMTFDRIVRADLLQGELEPPPELQGVELNVEFVSVLAQAQRAVATSGMDRFFSTLGQMAALNPAILDKANFDQAADDYAEVLGINPELVVPDDAVAKIRASRAEQQAQQQQAAMAAPMVDTAKTASEIDIDNMRNVMSSLQGYGTPT